jgi:hypothetical protein
MSRARTRAYQIGGRYTPILYVKRPAIGTPDRHPIGDAQQGIFANRQHQPSRNAAAGRPAQGNAEMCAACRPRQLAHVGYRH